MKIISSIEEIIPHYKAVFCDVWGVVHNGVNVFNGVDNAFHALKIAGIKVILLTNAPRPSYEVKHQLKTLGLPDDCYDDVVTSGDVTHALIEQQRDKKIFFLGPERDLPLMKGKEALLTSDFSNAEAVLCTGLFDDVSETPDHYNDMLSEIAKRGMPFICANPDVIVRRGDDIIYCAGALGQRLKTFGGDVYFAGKPYPSIYREAKKRLRDFTSEDVENSNILCIGDGLPTDIKGAIDNDFPCLFIFGGIHEDELMADGVYSEDKAKNLFQDMNAMPQWGMRHFI